MDQAGTPRLAETALAPDTAPKARILIVDDDQRTATAIATLLESLGQPLVTACSGEEALKRLLFEDFAVMLLDVQMPGMDGYEVASLVRARRRTRNIPIIFLTAVNRDSSHLLQAYSAGAVDMVFKPVDPFVLKSKVSIFVDLHLSQIEAHREAELRHRLEEENLRVRLEKADAEAALRRSHEREAAILRALPVCFHSRSPDPPFVPLFMSDTVEALTGFPASRFTAEPTFGISRIHPEDRDRVGKIVGRAPITGVYSCEFRWRCADGNYRVFLDQGVYTKNEDGTAEILGTMLDVTEQRSLQSQLAQAQKMEAVGQLTGGIAHDFNNLLTVIFGNIDLLVPRFQSDDKVSRKLLAMRYAAERARSLTGQLLAFSRRQRLMPEAIDVGDRVRSFTTLLQQALGEHVALSLVLPDAAVVCELDPAQFESTLLNLAVNARDAMPQGGKFEVEVAQVETAGELREQYPEAVGGPWARMRIRDTGVGMPREILDRIFEPFFTTKETGKGSGLGLSQVYGFVRQSGGFILAESTPTEGTLFTILLPVSDKEAVREAEQSAEHPRDGTRRSETILVVEDDSAVLALTSDMLSELGYRVLTAGDANRALAILRKEPQIDLLFTDVVMPGGKTGVQLANAAQQMRPEIKVLLTSGYVGEELTRHKAGDHDLPLIAKPFHRRELDERIRTVMQAEA